MSRKKWTAKSEVSAGDIVFREKRKWQIALRRYIIEGKPATAYAPYFGLDTASFRRWISAQFTPACTWENFGDVWQIDHIVPVSMFDITSDADLHLCWNFINVRVTDLNEPETLHLLQAKSHFQRCLDVSGLEIYQSMISRIEKMEISESLDDRVGSFLQNNKDYIKTLSVLDTYDFSRLNQGDNLPDVLAEKEKLKTLGL